MFAHIDTHVYVYTRIGKKGQATQEECKNVAGHVERKLER